MNDLEQYFAANTENQIKKWKHYFEIYDRYFSRYRGTDVHMLEFGVLHGGSLKMWKHYFGPTAKIYGVDINPHCKDLEEDQIEIFIGDQEDKTFLRSLGDRLPRIDILLDDGGHTMKQQIHTFEVLFPAIDQHGFYICEDLHSSYWKKFGGGYRRRGTFIEYSKQFIDALHAWHSKQPQTFQVSDFTQSAYALHYYTSMLVIEKRPMEAPVMVKSGEKRVRSYRPPKSFSQRVRNGLRRRLTAYGKK
ncbi:class I SAM-dependent methyltransferase [candidate division KSB3 bacterium]|uniref:Class I SAM-dependent methyltransferase n=1 Tax=candidate division KSB3 bacterium TaxID=2044937 RepID=A0A9D5Q7R3_9BACT|nr:class I SAM-dependent methyltransferase [candidate division KSB3 bacterium]MBD3326176.1 class I SAM-dependent methyltransferase [candidate division KSB3 bacterium]